MPEIQLHPRRLMQVRNRRIWALALIVAGTVGLLASFIASLHAFALLAENSAVPLLLQVPPGAIGVALATVLIVCGVAALAIPMPAESSAESADATTRTSVTVGVTMLLLGAIGWGAAFALTADKVVTLLSPGAALSCNVSVLVQCGANLESWQGSVFGFPNPLIGLVGWSAVLTVAVLVLAKVRLRPWFWVTFNPGVAAALVFVIWLIAQSIFVLGTLCPWCMVTWSVTIPLFWMTTLGNAAHGRFGTAMRSTLGVAYSWTPLITVVSYLVVAVIAQLRLDLLLYL